jgi:hypothetical protein
MKKTKNAFICLVLMLAGVSIANQSFAVNSEKTDTSKVYFFIKKELNTGLYLYSSKEREELNTNETTNKEEIFLGSAGFRFENRVWNFLSFKQEFIDLTFDLGPFFGFGNWLDTTTVSSVDGNHSTIGIRAKLNIDYVNRFYYDHRNFTLIEVSAWGKNDLYFQNMEGVRVDSANLSTDFKNKDLFNKFRYGFQAKAGWGYGKLNPMNHYMTAGYIASEYYKGRNFSENEIEKLAAKINDIKQRRDPGIQHSPEKELAEIKEFLRSTMLLSPPEISVNEWETGEFVPRLQGSRIEFGPFFNYYNYEPDFYYGGFINYDCGKYINSKWNRNLNANVRYNIYKHHDWATFETNLGWSYYSGLKSKYSFGLKYIPGMVIRDWDDMDPVKHNFVPYVEYYTQVNAKTRMNLSFAWKIGDGENFMLSGPEFSLVIYQSRY